MVERTCCDWITTGFEAGVPADIVEFAATRCGMIIYNEFAEFEAWIWAAVMIAEDFERNPHAE